MKSSSDAVLRGRTRPGRVSEAGFSLIEVIVAVVLVGITFGALMQAFSQSFRTIQQVDAYQTAVQLAQNKMNELLIDEAIFEDGVLEGAWDVNYRWRVAMETQEIDDLAVQKDSLSTRMLYLRLTVFFRLGEKERSLRMFTIKHVRKPAVGEAGHLGGGFRSGR